MNHQIRPAGTRAASHRPLEIGGTGQAMRRRKHAQADSSVRPLRRRAARIARPARVRMRRRKPCVFARRRLLGWKVRLLTSNSKNRTYTADALGRCSSEPATCAGDWGRGNRAWARGKHLIGCPTLRRALPRGQTDRPAYCVIGIAAGVAHRLWKTMWTTQNVARSQHDRRRRFVPADHRTRHPAS